MVKDLTVPSSLDSSIFFLYVHSILPSPLLLSLFLRLRIVPAHLLTARVEIRGPRHDFGPSSRGVSNQR